MKPPEKPPADKDKPPPRRLEEARRIINEYAASLREIIRKLRKKMN
jgi:signal recognition particle subunit SEC65